MDKFTTHFIFKVKLPHTFLHSFNTCRIQSSREIRFFPHKKTRQKYLIEPKKPKAVLTKDILYIKGFLT